MGFNRENYRRIKREYDGKNLRAKEEAERRREELHARFPEIKEIDDALSMTGLAVLEASSRYAGARLEDEIAGLKRQNQTLLADRANCLAFHGLPADYSDVKYECPDCMDTGFAGLAMCRCMKEKLVLAGYESSGIGTLIRTKTFDNFDPDYQKQEGKAAENNRLVYQFCQKYAEQFDDLGSPNLLFIGATGLGKTHLSAAIAGRIINRGYDAVCETAQNFFADFEFERFNRPYGGRDAGEESKTDKYFDCDLLILDDLGTEMTNQFTVSCLYNIINTRLNRGRSMIINTNLTRDELKKRYADRITSRLFGEFLPMIFLGRDMRELRLD
ncbi:MAG: DNA replication protein DnaC [Ruminococcaceae bacterium]|nr:DNA replication protein DnaC [Oscillospiraceae bacterium]